MTTNLIGLTGFAGAGKDTVADILCEEYGFVKFSFSDALYREVADAFGASVAFLQDRNEKEKPQAALALINCDDARFIGRVLLTENCPLIEIPSKLEAPRKPRDILQLWGTEYRRADDPDYWVKRAQEFAAQPFYDSCAGLVNTSVRFANEADWISSVGEIWCVRRQGHGPVNGHVSEKEQPHSLVIQNDGTIEDLRLAVARIFYGECQ